MARKRAKPVSGDWSGPRPTPEAVRAPSLGFCAPPAECYRSRRSLVIWGMSVKGFSLGTPAGVLALNKGLSPKAPPGESLERP
jgi:hypothetical protein